MPTVSSKYFPVWGSTALAVPSISVEKTTLSRPTSGSASPSSLGRKWPIEVKMPDHLFEGTAVLPHVQRSMAVELIGDGAAP